MPYPFVAAEVLTAANLNAMIGAPTQNAINDVTYTAALLDAGKTVTLSNASAVTLTIPAQATVAWAANTQLNFLNLGVGTVTITPAADVTINGTPLTLATSKGGSLVRTASNTWTFIPFSGGEGDANFTNTATGTYTDGGIDYKFVTFTGSGDLIVDRAGFADILVIGGGGGGGGRVGGGGGGAGGYNLQLGAVMPIGTHSVTVGAGGAGGVSGTAGVNGGGSSIGDYFIGLGGGGGGVSNGSTGGSAGGSGRNGSTNVTPIYVSLSIPSSYLGSGNSGARGTNSGGGYGVAGGGGGSGTAGGQGTYPNGGSGGNGLSDSFTGSVIVRAGGGGGGSGVPSGVGTGTGGTGGGANGTASSSTANSAAANSCSGGGGGGGYSGGGNGGSGGSGIVIVRVVV